MKQEPEEQFFEKAKTVAKQIDNGTYSKELSDEEIWAIASEIEPIDLAYGVRLSNELNVLDFARAILKKASEK